MNALLSLSRAAHLLGVTRSALQNRIRSGELTTFDGMISLAELRAAYPDLNTEDSGAFEKVNDIKTNAFGKRIRERALPSQEILAQRIFTQSEELEALRRHLQQYHTLVTKVLGQLPPDSPVRADIEEQLGHILASEPSTLDNALKVMHTMLKVVSAQVTVRPSGHEFIVEGQDSLLQAGLKAGLRLDYGCGSGNCGLCKTRVVSGEVQQIAPADYRLSEAERASGHVLACVCAPVTDVVIEMLEASGPQDIPLQDLVATVRTLCEPKHPDAPWQIHLQTPRSNRLRFLAGQSATLGLRTPAGDIAGSFPIASCPCDDRNLHFHVAPNPDDPLARALQAGWIKVNDPINLRGPQGDFTLDPESSRPLVFICCDTGFGPVKSLIEHAMAIDRNDTFGLIWVAPEGAHYLDNQCRMWADAYDRFIYRPLNAIRQTAGRDFSGEAVAAVRAAHAAFPFLHEADIYVAGPAEFVEQVPCVGTLLGEPKLVVRRTCMT